MALENVLTLPEVELLKHLLDGKTVIEVATETNTNQKLVNSVRHSLFKKMNCKNQFELMARHCKKLEEKCYILEAELAKLRGGNAA